MVNPTRREPVRKRDWMLSIHAEERCAKRFNLLVDGIVRQLISQELDSHRAKLLDIRTGSILVYEITIMKTTMIAVCNTRDRNVVTFLKPDRWHRHHPQIRKRKHGHPLANGNGQDSEE